MIFKKQIKIFQRATARWGLYGSSWLLKRLPFGAVRVMKSIILPVGFALTIRQKKVARESLRIAFGESIADREIGSIVENCFKNLGAGMIEMFYFLSHPEMVTAKVEIEGLPHLDEALKKGKGVVAVTAHFGNFPLMMLDLALKGYKTNSIIRPTRDEKLEEYLLKKRTECGLKTIYAQPRTKCVDESLKALRNNEMVFIPLDQNFGSDKGVFVDFFGQKAATATGPVIFAKRTGAAVIPMFIVRTGEDTHKIMIEPPMEIEEKENDDETILYNISRITHLIETYIRRYPHEWGWMHRRWKTRPIKKIKQSATGKQ